MSGSGEQHGCWMGNSMTSRATTVVFFVLALIWGQSQGRAASFLEKDFWLSGPRYDRVIPACDYRQVIANVIDNFHAKEARFWNSELRILTVEDLKETAVLPWAAQSIPRRFCSGVAVINDGTRHPIFFSIGEDTGMIGAVWGVQSCVVGLDRNWAFNPLCAAAQP
jgi:hypothetical protein